MMTHPNSGIKTALLLFFSFFLTAVTFVFGASPLYILRKGLGRGLYWLIFLGLFAFLLGFRWYFYSISFLLLVLMIGFYTELEKINWPLALKGLVSVFLSTFIVGGIYFFWATSLGHEPYAYFQSLIEGWMSQGVLSSELYAQAALSSHEIVKQTPSVIMVLLMLALFVAIKLEPRVWALLGAKETKTKNLKGFTLPDFFIWILMASLLGTFLKSNQEWLHVVSVNVLNVTLFAYFFQGLAVTTCFFDFFKMSTFWRIFWLVILIGQLFLVLSILGVVDYWADFRKKLKKKMAKINNNDWSLR